MAKFVAQGADLQIGNADDGGTTLPGVDTFANIGNVRGFSGPSGEKPEIDVTDLDSTGKEYLAGIPDFGTIQFTGWFNELDAQQDDLWADFLDAASSHIRNYRVVLPNAEATTFDFNGFIQALEVNTQTEEAVELNGTIRVSGGITKTSS